MVVSTFWLSPSSTSISFVKKKKRNRSRIEEAPATFARPENRTQVFVILIEKWWALPSWV